jgi:hypothetical protein
MAMAKTMANKNSKITLTILMNNHKMITSVAAKKIALTSCLYKLLILIFSKLDVLFSIQLPDNTGVIMLYKVIDLQRCVCNLFQSMISF